MELMEVISKRQSVRAYKSEAVSGDLIQKVMLAGSMAPVGMGQYENVHMTLVTNQEILKKIDVATAQKMGKPEAHPIYGVSAMIIVSTRPGKFVIPGIESANCGCIMENMMLSATANDLGSVYLLAATEALCASEEIMAALNIPEGFKPTASLGIGYPVTELKPREVTQKIKVNVVK